MQTSAWKRAGLKLAKLIALLGAAAIFTLCVMIYFMMHPSHPDPGPVSERLGAEFLIERRTIVDLAQLTSFAWTELRIFHPYDDRGDMCSNLRLAGRECGRSCRFT